MFSKAAAEVRSRPGTARAAIWHRERLPSPRSRSARAAVFRRKLAVSLRIGVSENAFLRIKKTEIEASIDN